MRRRLLMVVAIVGLVALVLRLGFDSQNWYWPARPIHRGPTDTILRQTQVEERMEGQFRAPAPAAERPESTRKFFPGVREKYLTEVRDDDFFRPRENNAFFHLLQVLAEADQQELQKASMGEVSFAQLHDQPAAFRGEVVTLRGRLRQLQRMVAVQNEFDVKDYYQATIQPDDNPTFPVLVYIHRLPTGFPSKLELAHHGQLAPVELFNEEVKLDGFFFKRLAYRAKDDVRTAPLILADTFQWQAGPAPGSVEVAATRNFMLIALGISAALLLLVLVVVRGRGTLASWSGSSRTEPAAGQLAQLNNADLLSSPLEHLKKLEQQSPPAPPR